MLPLSTHSDPKVLAAEQRAKCSERLLPSVVSRQPVRRQETLHALGSHTPAYCVHRTQTGDGNGQGEGDHRDGAQEMNRVGRIH